MRLRLLLFKLKMPSRNWQSSTKSKMLAPAVDELIFRAPLIIAFGAMSSRVVRSIRVERTLRALTLVREENLENLYAGDSDSFREHERERQPQVGRCGGRERPAPCRLHPATRHFGGVLRHQVPVRLGRLRHPFGLESHHARRAAHPHALRGTRLPRHLISVGQSEVETEKVVVIPQAIRRVQLAQHGSSLTSGAISFLNLNAFGLN